MECNCATLPRKQNDLCGMRKSGLKCTALKCFYIKSIPPPPANPIFVHPKIVSIATHAWKFIDQLWSTMIRLTLQLCDFKLIKLLIDTTALLLFHLAATGLFTTVHRVHYNYAVRSKHRLCVCVCVCMSPPPPPPPPTAAVECRWANRPQSERGGIFFRLH